MGANRVRDVTGLILIVSHMTALVLCAASSYLHGFGIAVQVALYISPLFAYYVYTVLSRLAKDMLLLDDGPPVRRSFTRPCIGVTAVFGLFMNLAVLAFAAGLIGDVKAASQLIGTIETTLALYMSWLVGTLFGPLPRRRGAA